MRKKKILLLYISDVSGHRSASYALEKSLLKLNSDLEIKNMNAVDHTNPVLSTVVNQAYMSIVRIAPEFWSYLYDNPDVLARTQKIRKRIHEYNSKIFDQMIHSFDPDCVICTQAFPCTMAANFKKNHDKRFYLVGCLTDYAPHAYWVDQEIDCYITPSVEIGKKLADQGVLPEKIHHFGIPIDPTYAKTKDVSRIKEKIDIVENEPVVLLMGGGQGIGPMKKTVALLEQMSDVPFHLIVLTGTNKNLRKHLEKNRKKAIKKITVLGWIDYVDQLLQIADLVITKPGGLTVQESLAKKTPLIILKPLPGQEILNTKYLLRQKVAVLARKPHDVVVFVRELLSNPDKIKIMRSNITEDNDGDSALRSARFILEKL